MTKNLEQDSIEFRIPLWN